MAMHVTLDSADVQRVIDAMPSTIFNAQRSAISTTTTWAGNELRNRMLVKTGIPSRVFRRYRVKIKRNRETGTVWIGLNKVKASYVGNMEWRPGGAVAGDYYFPHGFIATMKSGHTGIFMRKGKSRLPLVEQAVDLQLGFDVAEDVAREAQIELRNRFVAKVRELNPGID